MPMPHRPGTPLDDNELEEVCRWMTAVSNSRIRTLCADLTKEQAMEIRRRMSEIIIHADADDPDGATDRRRKLM